MRLSAAQINVSSFVIDKFKIILAFKNPTFDMNQKMNELNKRECENIQATKLYTFYKVCIL